MIIKSKSVSLFFVILVLFNSQQIMAAEKLGKLPEIFSPLTWKTNPKKIKDLIPHIETSENSYGMLNNDRTVKVKAIYLTQKNREYFGDALIVVQHRKGKIVGIIIYTDDTREECAPPPGVSPKHCRGYYSEDLKSILYTIKDQIEKSHGKADSQAVTPDYSSEHKQHFFVWEPVGYKLYLHLATDEEDYWAVTLSATKNKF